MQLFKYYGNKIHKDGMLLGGVTWEMERRVREFCEKTETFGEEEFKQLFEIANNAVQSRFFIDDRDFGWTFGHVDDMWVKSCPLKDYRYINYSKEFCVRFGRIAIASFYFTPVEESMWRRDEEDMDESRHRRGRTLRESVDEKQGYAIDKIMWSDLDEIWKVKKVYAGKVYMYASDAATTAERLVADEAKEMSEVFNFYGIRRTDTDEYYYIITSKTNKLDAEQFAEENGVPESDIVVVPVFNSAIR